MNNVELGMKFNSSQKMSQQIKLSQQMKIGMAILKSSIQDLQQEISTKLQQNPALEIQETDNESIESLEIDAEEILKQQESDDNYEASPKEHNDFAEQILSTPETLAEHLLWQLRMEDIREEYFEIGSILIENLDVNGFFIDDPYTLVEEVQDTPHSKKIQAQDIAEVISLIQEFEPVGCACNNSLESLHIQLSCLEIDHNHREMIDEVLDKMETLIQESNTQDALGTHALSLIEEFLERYEQDVIFQEYFKKLVPHPGRAYVHNHIDKDIYIIPDAMVIQEHGELMVKVNNDIIPVLSINSTFANTLTKGKKSDNTQEAKKFAKSYLDEANAFISGIEFRTKTLERVLGAMVMFQKEYFLGNSPYLLPLTRKQIAEQLQLDQSTVSRTIADKYIQTKNGVKVLKYFFSQRSGDNEDVSAQQVQQEISNIINGLRKDNKKISDRIITEELEKQGFSIKRRTVSKYRKQLEG